MDINKTYGFEAGSFNELCEKMSKVVNEDNHRITAISHTVSGGYYTAIVVLRIISE